MDLKDYFSSFPRQQRVLVRRHLAEAHGVAEVTIRAWANGYRRHPCNLVAVTITETVTGHRVTRHDLRPEIFGAPPETEMD